MMIVIGTDDGLFVDGERTAFEGRSVVNLSRNGSGGWALLDGGGLVALGAGSVGAVLETGVELNCVLPAGDELWLGGPEARLFRLVEGTAVRHEAFDNAPDRNDWHTPWGGPPDVRSMAVGVEGDLLVNVHVGGVVRSTDGGASWQSTMDISADVHQVAAHPSAPGVAYVASAWGFGWMEGDEWRFTSDGLHASYCRAVARATRHIFVSVSTGPGGARSAVYRTDAAGRRFSRCGDGLPEWFTTNIDTHCLAAHDGVVVIGDRAGVVYRSDDEGDTWAVAFAGLPPIRCLEIIE